MDKDSNNIQKIEKSKINEVINLSAEDLSENTHDISDTSFQDCETTVSATTSFKDTATEGNAQKAKYQSLPVK